MCWCLLHWGMALLFIVSNAPHSSRVWNSYIPCIWWLGIWCAWGCVHGQGAVLYTSITCEVTRWGDVLTRWRCHSVVIGSFDRLLVCDTDIVYIILQMLYIYYIIIILQNKIPLHMHTKRIDLMAPDSCIMFTHLFVYCRSRGSYQHHACTPPLGLYSLPLSCVQWQSASRIDRPSPNKRDRWTDTIST